MIDRILPYQQCMLLSSNFAYMLSFTRFGMEVNLKKSKRILAVTLASALLFCLCLSVTSDAAGLKMSKSKLTLYVKKSSSLKLIGAKNKEVTWKSSNKKIATVSVSKSNSAKATVKAKNVGKATITAKCGKKK
ncbi:MAG: Ig-like domain-containing protein, partial [Eubacterium sp.]|nr:Ig-like domain-containing protein [Eubacterium sp.]